MGYDVPLNTWARIANTPMSESRAPDFSKLPTTTDRLEQLAKIISSNQSANAGMMQARTNAAEEQRKADEAAEAKKLMAEMPGATPTPTAPKPQPGVPMFDTLAKIRAGMMGMSGSLPGGLGGAVNAGMQAPPPGPTLSTPEGPSSVDSMDNAIAKLQAQTDYAMRHNLPIANNLRQALTTMTDRREASRVQEQGQAITSAGQAETRRSNAFSEGSKRVELALKANPNALAAGSPLREAAKNTFGFTDADVDGMIQRYTGVRTTPVGEYGAQLAQIGDWKGMVQPPQALIPGVQDAQLRQHMAQRLFDVNNPMPGTENKFGAPIDLDIPGADGKMTTMKVQMKDGIPYTVPTVPGEAPVPIGSLGGNLAGQAQSPAIAQRRRATDNRVSTIVQAMYTNDPFMSKVESTHQAIQGLGSALKQFEDAKKTGGQPQWGALDNALIDGVVRIQTTGKQAVRSGFVKQLEDSESLVDYIRKAKQKIASTGNIGPELRDTLMKFAFTAMADEFTESVTIEANKEKELRRANPDMSPLTRDYDRARRMLNSKYASMYIVPETRKELQKTLDKFAPGGATGAPPQTLEPPTAPASPTANVGMGGI